MYLISIGVNLPVGDAIVLGDLLALRHLLGVSHADSDLLAILMSEVIELDTALGGGSVCRCR